MPRSIIVKDKHYKTNLPVPKKIKINTNSVPVNQPTTDVPFAIRNNIDSLINQLEKIKIEIDNLIILNKA